LTGTLLGNSAKEKIGSIGNGVSRNNVYPLKPNWQSIVVDLLKRKEPSKIYFSKTKLLKHDFELVDFVMAEVSKILSSKVDGVERSLPFYLESDGEDELIQLLKSKSA
jgi:hypothetical protein